MKRLHSLSKGFFCWLLIFLLPASPVFAEIYKWVDEDGKVHFGDKPKDDETSQASEKVELQQNYVPGEGIPEEQIQAQRDFLRKKDEQRKQQKQNREAAALKRKELQADCDRMRNQLKGYTTANVVSGRVQRKEYFTENGEPVTSRRQDEIVAELEKSINKKCGTTPLRN